MTFQTHLPPLSVTLNSPYSDKPGVTLSITSPLNPAHQQREGERSKVQGPLRSPLQCYTPEHQPPPFSKAIWLITFLLSKLYTWKVLCLSSYRLLSFRTLWGSRYVCGCMSDRTRWGALPPSPNIDKTLRGGISLFRIIARSKQINYNARVTFSLLAVNQDGNTW